MMMLGNFQYGWMDDLQFYVLFNSISVISGRWADGNERLCATEPRLRLGRFRLERDSNSGPLISGPALNPLSYRSSWLLSVLRSSIHWVRVGQGPVVLAVGVFSPTLSVRRLDKVGLLVVLGLTAL